MNIARRWADRVGIFASGWGAYAALTCFIDGRKIAIGLLLVVLSIASFVWTMRPYAR